MQLPPGFVLDDQPSGPVYGAPKVTDPLDEESKRVTIQKGQQDIANNGLDVESKRQSIASSQAGMENQQFNQNQGLRQEFNALPLSKNYGIVAQKVGTALHAPAGPQGDLDVLYAFATAMDPNSVVRESEQEMAKQTASVYQQLQQKYRSYLEGNGLPPEVRTGLIETMRRNFSVINDAYNQSRSYYSDLAKRNGFDPYEVVGPHLAETIQPYEADYIRAHGGNPKLKGQPYGAPGGEAQFKDEQRDLPNSLTPAQQEADRAFLAKNPTPEQYQSFLEGLLGRPMDAAQTAARLEAARKGGGYNAGIARPEIMQRVEQLKQEQGTGTGDAMRVGARDGYFLGAGDELHAGIQALDQSLGGQGDVGDLYNRNYAAEQEYVKGLQGDHPYAYAGGQVVGGLVPGAVTFGASTPAQLAKQGAAVGGIYGFNSGEGGLENRAASLVEGGAAGGLLGYAIPKGVQLWQGRKAASTIPDLVDPVTGRLNEPLEAARPGERVAAAKDYGIDLPMGAATDRGGAIIEKGLDNLPGSAGVMNDARRSVEGQVADAADNVAGQFGASRTMNEAGAELQRGAQERIARGNQVIEKAYGAIPIAPTANASTTSTKATLQSLTSRFQSNPDLADALKDPTLNRYLNAVDKGLSWQDLKDFRSIIGEKIGNARFGESSSVSDLRALYAGLTEDMKNTAASMGPGALRAFERANNLYRNEQQLIETSLTRILGKDGSLAPEKAAAAVQAMTKGGKSTGDLRTLGQIKAATVKSGAWDEIAATLIRLGGQPANSQGRQFSAQTFVQWYADMAPAARAMLFKPELRKSLESFVAVNQRLAGTNALRNTSQTLPNMVGATVVGSTGTAAAMGHPGTLLAMGAGMVGNYGMAKLWTSPAFVQWATGYSRAASTGNANAIRSQIGRLSKLASTNPELRDPLQKLIQSFANDNMAPGLAASQPDQDQQSQ